VAGYLLLRLSALDRLWNWPGNLPDQMLWMPDVAVIHAWRLIRQEQESPSPPLVRQEQARERGIPVYTEGLRLLISGLKLSASGPTAKTTKPAYDLPASRRGLAIVYDVRVTELVTWGPDRT
jgi:hypothetical protein